MTIVFSKRGPLKVLVYDNDRMADIVPPSSFAAVVWINAADLGEVAVMVQFAPLQPDPFSPAAGPPWAKGDTLFDGAAIVFTQPIELVTTVITRPALSEPIIAPLTTNTRADRLYQWILVGTRPSDARIVVVDRPA